MSQYLAELCTLLIDDLYGGLSSQVFSTIARLGRQPLAGLVRHSNLSARHLKHGLVILIQQHLALHYTSEIDGIAYYEANWQHAYDLVRSGKIIKFVEDRFGEKAGGIISNLLLLGHTKVSDLSDAYGVTNKKANSEAELKHANRNGISTGNGLTNGDAFTNEDGLANGVDEAHDVSKTESHIDSRGQLHSILHQLLHSGWIVPVQESHFWPSAEHHNEAEVFVISTHFEGKVPKGPKKAPEFARRLKERKRKNRDEALEIPQMNGIVGSKRYGSSAVQPSKRVKLNDVGSARTNGYSDSEHLQNDVWLNGDLVVRINHEKCNVAFRTEQLTRLAARYIGETTSKVYETLLRLLEEQTPRCYDEFAEEAGDDPDTIDISPMVTAQAAAEAIDPNIDLTDGLQEDSGYANGVNGNTNDENDESDQGLNGHSVDDVNKRRRLVDQHIRLLSEDPRHFTHWVSSRGMSQWKVDFPRLARILIQTEIEDTVTARHERMGTRLIRILHNKGKLDEKQVSNFSMTPPKTIRSTLTGMQEAGFVETQEVPKDTSRQPSRTMYLWFYDQQRCRQLLLTDTYKAMARILQRIKVERAKVQTVIDKAERTDVVGHEEQYLSKMERQALRDWSQTEEKLLIQLGRQDNLVATLRDFISPLNS